MKRLVDAALLLLPGVDFVAYDDPRMLRTTQNAAGGNPTEEQ